MAFDTYDTDSIITGGITFSGGNLVAQATTGSLAASRIAQTIEGKTAGKWYVEFTCGGVSGNVDGVGVVCSMGIGASGFVGGARPTGVSSNASWGWYTNDHVVANNSTVTHVNGATWTTGDVIGMAIDLDNGRIWWRKNTGGWVGTTGTPDPATNTGGFDISFMTTLSMRVYPAANMSGNGAKFTANFGASAFTGSVPSGFTSGWTNTVTAAFFGTFATNGFGQQTSTPPQNDLSVSKYVSNFSGTVDHVIIPLVLPSSDLKCVIYDNTGTGGLPGALLGVSTSASSGFPGENTFSGFSPTVTLVNGSTYYIGVISDISPSTHNESECGGTAAAGIWFVAGTYASPDNPFPSSPSTVNFRYPLMVFKSTANTETGTGVLGFSGISFAGSGSEGPAGSGILSFSGIAFVGSGSEGPAASGVLSFSGITIVSSGFDLGAAGRGVRQFWFR